MHRAPCHSRSIADSEGFVCDRDAFDYSSGCCAGGDRYKCQGCSAVDKCCDAYEVCISCCLDPQNNATTLAAVTPR